MVRKECLNTDDFFRGMKPLYTIFFHIPINIYLLHLTSSTDDEFDLNLHAEIDCKTIFFKEDV